ncbi:MAG: creatininase family protein [Anaerolineales bacterium]|nr:creatininase family protein [Anaerolineales bacterium]
MALHQDQVRWRWYQELRPDQLAEVVRDTPVVYWPLGLIEHHGWHLPLGLDGIKVERACMKMAERTGGVILPTMWWGGVGGHGDFMWTLYQPEEASSAILGRTIHQLVVFGFRAIVLFAGHYPWQHLLDQHVPPLQEAHPEVLFLWGTEVNLGGDLRLPGDHAAREETSYGLHLLPELVDMDALRPGRDESAWPGGRAPDLGQQYPGLKLDPGDPLFAQFGEDARTGSAERGETGITQLVDCVVEKINVHLTAHR